jgi:hypothetical protein
MRFFRAHRLADVSAAKNLSSVFSDFVDFLTPMNLDIRATTLDRRLPASAWHH